MKIVLENSSLIAAAFKVSRKEKKRDRGERETERERTIGSALNKQPHFKRNGKIIGK